MTAPLTVEAIARRLADARQEELVNERESDRHFSRYCVAPLGTPASRTAFQDMLDADERAAQAKRDVAGWVDALTHHVLEHCHDSTTCAACS